MQTTCKLQTYKEKKKEKNSKEQSEKSMTGRDKQEEVQEWATRRRKINLKNKNKKIKRKTQRVISCVMVRDCEEPFFRRLFLLHNNFIINKRRRDGENREKREDAASCTPLFQ